MNPANKSLRLVLALLACGWIISCSSDRIADGGTHVGNPDLTAAVIQSFDALLAGDRWLADSYVPGGEEKLNPDAVGLHNPCPSLGKRWIERGDTTVGETLYVHDTLFVDDTIPFADTLLLYDTTRIADTIVNIYTVHDTLDTLAADDSVHIVKTSQITDTVVIFDTLVAVDSIFYHDTAFVKDTLVIRDTIAVSDSTIHRSYTDEDSLLQVDVAYATGDNPTVSHVVAPEFDSIYAAPAATPLYIYSGQIWYAVDTENFSLTENSDGVLYSATYAVSPTQTVTESYHDFDGDGLLKTANTGPARISYLVELSGAGESMSSRVIFDGGVDGDFSSTTDNRIAYLYRNRTTGDTTGYIYYRSDTTGMEDTLVLQSVTYLDADSIESTSTTYKLTRQSDSLDHRSDGMVALEREVVFRIGPVRRLTLLMRPVTGTEQVDYTILPRGQGAEMAAVEAVMELTDGSTTYLESGRIDLNEGLLVGYYVDEEGRSGQVTIDSTGTEVRGSIEWIID